MGTGKRGEVGLQLWMAKSHSIGIAVIDTYSHFANPFLVLTHLSRVFSESEGRTKTYSPPQLYSSPLSTNTSVIFLEF